MFSLFSLPDLSLLTTVISHFSFTSQVDHGKTTLVDKLLDACAENIDNDDGGDRAMDSLDLERERGACDWTASMIRTRRPF